MTKPLVVLLGVVALLGVGRPCQATKVAVFGDPGFVDTTPSTGEFERMKASLQSVEGGSHTVAPFTGVTAAIWQAVLDTAEVVVIPELEVANLLAAMPDDARAVLASFVLKGNGLVVCGDANARAVALLNSIFGFLVSGATVTSQPSALQGAAAAGTAFAGGPASLPFAGFVYEVGSTSLPPGSAGIYKGATTTTVFTTTVGTTGRIAYLGHDWSAPTIEWVQVLKSAIAEVNGAVGKSFGVAMFDDPVFVDAASEGAALKAALESMGHVVSIILGTDEASWKAALSGAQILVIPELEVADLAAQLPTATKEAIQKFVLSGGGILTNASSVRSAALLNLLFGFSLTFGSAAGPYALNTANAAGTSFTGGPAQLPDVSVVEGLTVASLPAGAKSMYASGAVTTAFAMSRGLGKIVHSGFDWFTPAGRPPWMAGLSCGLAFASQAGSLAPSAPAVAAGATAQVSADLSGVADMVSAAVRFRIGGDPVFLTVPLVQTGPTWAATIPGSSVTNKGVQYYIELRDGVGVGTWPPGAPRTPLNLPVTLASQPILSLPANSYRLAGVPLQAGNPNPISIFDELGGYDIKNWRYGTYDGAAYHEPGSGAANATPGQGFWIIAKNAASIATGGTATDVGADFLVTLRPGFNQIADPFAFPVDFADVTLPAGVEANLIGYDGTAYVQLAATLEPGQGYWLKNNNSTNVQIAIRPLGAGVAPVPARALATRAGSEADGAAWCLELAAFAGGFADRGNLMGARLGASDERDPYDLSEPPAPPAGWVRLGFASGDGGELLADWRPATGDGATWRVSFASDQAGQPFHIDLVTLRALPSGWSVAVFEGSREIGLGNPSQIAGVVGSTTAPRSFAVSVGSSSYLGRIRGEARTNVTALALTSPFPNPSAGGFAIDLALPKPVDDARVQIFDVRGRLVKTLLAGAASAGVQRLEWDGRTTAGDRAAAGVYFVKATAGAFSASRRAALLP